MSQILTKNAQSVQDVLTANGLESKVLVLSESGRTATEAATAIGCEVAQIAKSLIYYKMRKTRSEFDDKCKTF